MTLAAALQECFAGLTSVFAWPELGFLVAGVLMGAIVGILPGLGGASTLAILVPFAVALSPTEMVALLVGVAAVTSTTGDLTSILIGIPGESTSAATVVDGHPMAARGEAARAIGASLVSSLCGSIVGAFALALMVPGALVLARSIASPELFMLALLGVSFIASLSRASRLKGLAMGGLGLLLATVGLDPIGATPRFTFGQLFLWDGIGAIPVALGLLAVPEIVELSKRVTPASPAVSVVTSRLGDGARDAWRLWRLVLQSSFIGTLFGLIPGVGAGVSQWMAYGYAARRNTGGTPFGEGAVQGVIAPSAANNATLGASLVPAVALGIPGGLMSAILLGALIMKGLVPGPGMLLPVAQGGQLSLVFALVWFIVVGNVIATALAYVSSKWLVTVTQISAARLVPFLLLLTLVGAFTERRVIQDACITAAMGALGLLLVHYRWPRAPLLLGVVLGPLVENRLFLSIDAYGSEWLTRPGVIAIGGLIAAGLLMPLAKLRRPAKPSAAGENEIAAPVVRGETIFAMGLLAVLIGAFVIASSYPANAALAPRLIAVATLALLTAAVVVDRRARTTGVRPSSSPEFPSSVRVTAAWVLVYVILIYTLGFMIGAPLAIFAYLVVTSGERITGAVLMAAGAWVFLYMVLFRIFDVTFPPGAFFA